MMSLPPHLRTYVDPNCRISPPASSAVLPGDSAHSAGGPKKEYDWRRPLSTPKAPPAETPSQPLKLSRTLGTDGRNLHIQGNTVHHPTGRQMRDYPLNGRESDNYLRRMTGSDIGARRPVKDTVLAQHLLPGQGIGIAGEWGDQRSLPGLGQEDAMRDALAVDNRDNVADGLWPALRPDIHKWTDRPVSYAAPREQVRERLIPDSKAGLQYKANDFAALAYYSDALPQPAGSKARLESAEHLQLPLEKRGAARRALIDAPIPRAERARQPVADEVPFEDVAHRVYGARAAPTMLKAIKRVFKKLQRPHTLDYGAGLHDDMTDDRAVHGIPVSAIGGGERALSSVRQRVREQPVAPLAAFTGIGIGDGSYAVADHVDVSTSLRAQQQNDARLQHYGAARYADDEQLQGSADAISLATQADRALRAERQAAMREQQRQQREMASRIEIGLGDDDPNGAGVGDHVRVGSGAHSKYGQNDRRLVDAKFDGVPIVLDEQLAGAADHQRVDRAVSGQRNAQDQRLVAQRYETGGVLDEQYASQMDHQRLDQVARAQRSANQDARLGHQQYDKGGMLDDQYASQMDHQRLDQVARAQRSANQDARLAHQEYDKGGLLDDQYASQMDHQRLDQAARAQRSANQDARLAHERYDRGGVLDAEYGAAADSVHHHAGAQQARTGNGDRRAAYALQDANVRHSLFDSEIEQAANRETLAARARQNVRDASVQPFRVDAALTGLDGSAIAVGDSAGVSMPATLVRAPRQERAIVQDHHRGAFAGDEALEGATGAARIDLPRIERDAIGRQVRTSVADRSHERAIDMPTADHVQVSVRSRAPAVHRDAQRGALHDSVRGIARGVGLDETLVGDSGAFGANLQVRAQSAPPDPAHLIIRDQHRGIALGDAFGSSGAADALALSQIGTVRESRRADAVPNDAHLGGAYHAAHEQFEPSFHQQQVVTTSGHRAPHLKREANIQARVDNPDSDILTGLVKIGVDVPNADRAIVRLQERERGFLDRAANATGRADEMHTVVMNEMLVAQEPTHMTMSGATDGREGSLDLKLRARLRTETPPPASHYANNSRFGKMIAACPDSSSAVVAGSSAPKRSDSPLYRRRSVSTVPQQ